MADKGVKILVCATCGGENVKRDAWAVWSVPDQIWELEGEPFDHAYCGDCDSECRVEERQEER